MSDLDPRTVLARPDLAELALEGLTPAKAYRPTEAQRCRRAFTAIRPTPDAGADPVGQLVFGEAFDVLDTQGAFSWGRGRRDGCVGWAASEDLEGPADPPSHRVSALQAEVFHAPNADVPTRHFLPLNALVRVERCENGFALASGAGWIAETDLSAFDEFDRDPVSVAERHLGAPFLWGGREAGGLDGPGLIQQAYYACGHGCPRAPDLQAQALGEALDEDEPLRRGDLVLWLGQPGLMIDADHVIQADVFHRRVVVEPLADAVERNRATGLGEPTAYRHP